MFLERFMQLLACSGLPSPFVFRPGKQNDVALVNFWIWVWGGFCVWVGLFLLVGCFFFSLVGVGFFFLMTVMYCIVRKLGSAPANPFLHGIALYVVEGKY